MTVIPVILEEQSSFDIMPYIWKISLMGGIFKVGQVTQNTNIFNVGFYFFAFNHYILKNYGKRMV